MLDSATEHRVRQRIGTFLRRDKYRLDGLLGAGAMGAVYSATHRNGSRVAIKLLHPEVAQVEELRRRFLREGYLANKVEHPGVVRIVDDDVDEDGSTFLVMELLEGCTLDDEWTASSHRLPLRRAGDVTIALLDVLDAVHAEGIVHRDVKPENVFMTARGVVKLLDLGIARLLDSRTMTASGTMMGTPEFAAPEQAAGNVRDIDGRSDVYSVGAMLFALLTGRFVHEGRTAIETMVLAATRPARSIFDVWPDIPGGIANVVDVALMFDKTRRWASAKEMGVALGRAMHSTPDTHFDAGAASTERPPPIGVTGTLVIAESSKPTDTAPPLPLIRPARK